jgi:hypothetical protein
VVELVVVVVVEAIVIEVIVVVVVVVAEVAVMVVVFINVVVLAVCGYNSDDGDSSSILPEQNTLTEILDKFKMALFQSWISV